MFHACFIPIATCFASTLYHFYTFFRTNLLTRCHSASFCLLCLCITEKVQNPKCSEKTEKITEIRFRRKTPGARRTSPGEARGPHTWAGRDWALPGALGWCRLLGHLLATPFGLYIAPDLKLTKQLTKLPNTSPCSAATKLRFGGQKVLFRHPAGTGIDPRSHLHRPRRLHFASMLVCE